MKTPSSLFLLLAALAASPASSADLAPGQRCDKTFLDRVAAAYKGGNKISGDERVKSARVLVAAGSSETVERDILDINNVKTCDQATWRHLGEGTAQSWRSPALPAYWDANNAGGQAALMLVVDDFYKAVDPKALAAIAAADEVLDAAVLFGLIDAPAIPTGPAADGTVANAPPALADLLKGDGSVFNGSGGPVGAVRPRVVTLYAKGTLKPTVVTAAAARATMAKLIDQAGGPGDGVVKFRQAVLALGVELEKQGKTVAKHVPASSKLTAFLPGLPQGFAATPAEKSNALDAAKYGPALAKLVGAAGVPATAASTPELNLKDKRADALLDSVDLGLRNLLAARSHQIDRIMELAKVRLEGTSVDKIEAGLRMAERRSTANVDPKSLAGTTMDRLSQNSDYAELDRLFEDRKRRGDGEAWVKSAEGKKAQAELDAMRAAAQSATVEDVNGKKSVVVTVNGRKRVLGNVPANVDDAAARDFAADQVADLIMRDAKDKGKVAAVKAAIGGAGEPGKPMDDPVKPGLKPDNPTPPEAPKSAWEVAKNSKDAGCGSPSDLGKSEMQRIQDRMNERAGDVAEDNQEARGDLKKELDASDKNIRAECKEKEDALAKEYLNPDLADKDAERKTKLAELRAACNKRIEEARAAIWAKPKYQSVVDGETEQGDLTAAKDKTNEQIKALYISGINDSLDKLEKAYKKKDDAHRLDLERATGYRDPHFKESRVTEYFDKVWRKAGKTDAEELKAIDDRFDDCSKVFGFGVAGAKLKNPNADREEGIEGSKGVDRDCGVRAGVVAHFNSYKGQESVQAPVDTPADYVAPTDEDAINAELRRRREAAKGKK